MSTPLEVAEAALKKVHDAEVAAAEHPPVEDAKLAPFPASADIALGPTDVSKG